MVSEVVSCKSLKPSVNPVYLETFPSVVPGRVALHRATFLRENPSKSLRAEFDGRTPLRSGGSVALTGTASEVIGFNASILGKGGPGIIRSRFTALDAEPGQVAASALKAFLKISSAEDAVNFAQQSGFLGLYPELAIWRAAGGSNRIAGEPVDSWLWQVDRMRTLKSLLALEHQTVSFAALKKKLKGITEGSAKGCNGKIRYDPLHDVNDLGREDPGYVALREKGVSGCKGFAAGVIGYVLRETLVVTDIKDRQVMLTANCCLGYLYLQLALEFNLLLQSRDQSPIVLCRMCNSPTPRGGRGPAPLYCKKCKHARQNYPEAEAFERRQQEMKAIEFSAQRSAISNLISEYVDVYDEQEGFRRAEVALREGLSRSIKR
jgi:hypothetical protein